MEPKRFDLLSSLPEIYRYPEMATINPQTLWPCLNSNIKEEKPKSSRKCLLQQLV